MEAPYAHPIRPGVKSKAANRNNRDGDGNSDAIVDGIGVSSRELLHSFLKETRRVYDTIQSNLV